LIGVTILHVAAGNAYGGIEQMLVTLGTTPHPALQQEFVVSFSGRLERDLAAAGATVHRLPAPRASRPLMVWRARRAFSALQERVGPEAVVFHSAWPHAMFAASVRASGARIVFWQHQPITRPEWPDRWARLVRPDLAVFNSEFTAAHPAFPSVPGCVIHCPVPEPPPIDPALRDALRQELGAAPGDAVVLLAARFERWKGHDILVKAAEHLPADRPWRLWIAGAALSSAEQKYAAEVSSALASLSPELRQRISLLGERTDVPTLMRLADIYCQPNRKGEPFGMAIAEAMRSGLPSVVSGEGGAAELLDESCGIGTAPGDTAAVANALGTLIADARLRSRMGEAAAARAARLTDPASRLQDLATLVLGAATS
jgi:glycosyltransferase involved in cell wall biosynthesis